MCVIVSVGFQLFSGIIEEFLMMLLTFLLHSTFMLLPATTAGAINVPLFLQSFNIYSAIHPHYPTFTSRILTLTLTHVYRVRIVAHAMRYAD